MKTITYAMQKGGTGKTSISVSTAVELARAGKKTLLIDADPQGNATTWIYAENIKNELANVLLDNCNIKDAIEKTRIENLYIIPTAGINGKLKEYSDNAVKPAKLKNVLKTISNNFDFCIIDTSPSFGNFERSILNATNEIITVLQLDNFSKDGLNIFVKRLTQYYSDDLDTDAPRPLFNKIVFNSKNDSYKLQDVYLEQFKPLINNGYNLYVIPQDQAFKLAQNNLTTVQDETSKKDTLNALKDLSNDILGGK